MRRWDWIGRLVESDLPPTTRLVAHTVATFADKDGHCYPSFATIARRAGLDRRSVIRHIAVLSDSGWLMVAGRSNKHGTQSHSYMLSAPVDNRPESTGGGVTESLGVVSQIHRGVSQSHSLGGVTESPRTNPQRTRPSESPASASPVDTRTAGHLSAVVANIAKGMKI